MLSDERDRVRALAERNGWDPQDAEHIVFSRGLVALEHESGEATDLEGKRLLDMRTPDELKFTAFNALRDNESLRMNVTGLTTEYQALTVTNKYLREDELRARIAELERAADELNVRVHAVVGEPSSRWDRIKALIRAVVE